jgi:excinuclease ABC subunit C
MSKDSPGYVLLQQIRDESHRFAITANRKKKNKSTQFSALDKIKGLGKVKKRNILNHFKSLKNIKAATREDLCQVSGISIKIAEEIKRNL